MKRPIIIRVSDELLTLMSDPVSTLQYHCIWCGMVKAFPKRPCEVCGLYGNSSTPIVHDRVYIEFVHEEAPVPRIVKRRKPGPRRVQR